ncbi:MAG: DUF1704 domain-containing protein [Lachnospiraceae bacterium]|nr:DUF1704 domain-containing protein [Lachnospiraceae bacterium]
MNDILKIIDKTSIDEIKMLNNTNPDAKEEFINDDSLIKPSNVYDDLDICLVEKNIKKIVKAVNEVDIKTFEGSLLSKLLFNNLHKNDLVRMCYEYNHGKKDEDIRHRMIMQNKIIYGELDRDEFRKILSETYNKIDAKSLNAEEQKEFERLNELLPYIPKCKARPYKPSQRVLDHFSQMCEIFLGDILRHVPKKDKYTVNDVCDIINEIFDEELNGYGWCVKIREHAGYASVSQEDKIFYVPGKRSKGDYDYKSIRALIAHEIGVHVLRSIPYQKCKIKDMSLGMPDYLSFEEGLARAVEQAILKEYNPAGYVHYISLGLGLFYGYDFRKVYEIQWRLQGLSGNGNKQQCFDSVQRAFRGTGEVVQLKDVAYFNGSSRAYKYITKNLNSDTLFDDLFLSGKINTFSKIWRDTAYEIKIGNKLQNL